MAKRAAWRNVPSETVSSHQDRALDSTVFLLRSFGPTAFLLREDGETADLKVCLGERHTCTCPTFAREREPCKHICWLLLRKFQLPREHQYAFQSGLSDRQLLEVLQGSHLPKASAVGSPRRTLLERETGAVCRKDVRNLDVCPICLEGLLRKKLPVCYCRYGCGNSVHISCMKVWADSQGLSDGREMLRCPLCRESFGSLQLLREQAKNAARLFVAAEKERADRHLGVVCCGCGVEPIAGTCYRCDLCGSLYLCETCVKKGNHSRHPLASRTTRKEEWTPAPAGSPPDPEPGDGRCVRPGFASRGGDVAGECRRLLLGAPAEPPADVVFRRVPVAEVRRGSRLLDEGMQCRICLLEFREGQRLRTLPCRHQFHVRCVDRILLRSRSCPLDGYVVCCRRPTDGNGSSEDASVRRREDRLKDLFVPGIALLAQSARPSPACGATDSDTSIDASPFGGPRKKSKGNVAAGKAKLRLKDAGEDAFGDSAGDGLELRMTGFSITKE
ncbi:E3 ubiquitin-protein ligase ZSWIM2 isoform X2 [Gambusia affinis]|nr:E3 ubiquitin-protein ligase ZSWIM2 isoform X2 [Gambusia affinis]XP_043966415.1 E3 ubiquitin-protein ligase ZSWIM2 isoform X2 [Gambusia affinis]